MIICLNNLPSLKTNKQPFLNTSIFLSKEIRNFLWQNFDTPQETVIQQGLLLTMSCFLGLKIY